MWTSGAHLHTKALVSHLQWECNQERSRSANHVSRLEGLLFQGDHQVCDSNLRRAPELLVYSMMMGYQREPQHLRKTRTCYCTLVPLGENTGYGYTPDYPILKPMSELSDSPCALLNVRPRILLQFLVMVPPFQC